MIKLTIALIAILLSACSTTYQPIPEGYTGQTSTINDSYSNKGNRSAHYFILYKMDDKYVEHSWSQTRIKNQGQGMRFTPSIVSRQVLPKEQKFLLQGLVYFPTDIQAIFGNDMRVTKEFLFTPDADEIYTVRGNLDKSGSSVWLENAEGEIVEGSLGTTKND